MNTGLKLTKDTLAIKWIQNEFEEVVFKIDKINDDKSIDILITFYLYLKFLELIKNEFNYQLNEFHFYLSNFLLIYIHQWNKNWP